MFLGKILNDESPIAEYEIDEKKFVVVMVAKLKSTESSSSDVQQTSNNPSVSSPDTVSTTSTSTESKVTQPTTTSETPKIDTPSSSASATINSAESTIVLGEDYQKMVKQIMEMGYDKEQVERALRASFNNPDRAVEYLINGLPPEAAEPREETESNPPAAANVAVNPNPTLESSSPQSGENPLEFLRNQPQFQQMRQVIQQNPQLLSAVMQQIGQTNPQLLQLITQNQEAFVRMLNEPSTGTGGLGAGGRSGATPASAVPGGPPNIESLIGSATVTEQDKEAIERVS